MAAGEFSPQHMPDGDSEFGRIPPPGFLDLESTIAQPKFLVEPPPAPDQEETEVIPESPIPKNPEPIEYIVIAPRLSFPRDFDPTNTIWQRRNNAVRNRLH